MRTSRDSEEQLWNFIRDRNYCKVACAKDGVTAQSKTFAA